MSDDERDPDLFAWIGYDEYGHDGIGLKQAYVRAGLIPLVAVRRAKMDRDDLIRQLQQQADTYGKTIRLVRYVAGETIVTVTPRPQTDGDV